MLKFFKFLSYLELIKFEIRNRNRIFKKDFLFVRTVLTFKSNRLISNGV